MMTNEEIYTITRLSDGFWSIDEQHVRAFLVEGTDKAMLVDTGLGTGDLAETLKPLTKKPVFVVNTHTDGDHIGCNFQFESVFMHPAEFDRYYSKRSHAVAPSPIWEGSHIDLGTYSFEIALLPGHTPGSIALLERGKRFLIAGDSVQDANIYMFGSGRNIYAYIASMDKLCEMSGDFDFVYASHGTVRLGPEQIPKLKAGAQRLAAGELEAADLPDNLVHLRQQCKLYRFDGAGFLF